MKWIAFVFATLASVVGLTSHADAQLMQARVVSACGTPGQSLNAGANFFFTIDTNGNVCTSSSGGGGTITAVGPAANGAAVSGNPLLTAGSDGTNVRTLATDTAGREIVVGPAASGATAVGNPIRAGGVYNSSQPNFTNGQVGDVQIDSNGNLRVIQQDGFTGNGSLTNNTGSLFGPLDTSGYDSISVQVTAIATGATILTEVSNDNVNFVSVSNSPTNQVGLASDNSGSILATGMYNVQTTAKYFRVRQSVAGTGTSTVYVTLKRAPSVARSVYANLAAGGNLIGSVNLNSVLSGIIATNSNGGAISEIYLASAAASTNATGGAVTGAHRAYKVGGAITSVAGTTLRCIKLYDKASAPTVGTDTPVLRRCYSATGVFSFDLNSIGKGFTNGIAYAMTTGAADSDTGALTAGDVVGFYIDYQ